MISLILPKVNIKSGLLGLAIFLNLFPLLAQNYRLDSTFANKGKARRPLETTGINSTRIFRNADGSILNCGNEYVIGANAHYNNIWKLNACGQTDSSFGENGLIRHTFEQRNIGYDYALQPDGKIVVVGTQAPSNAGSQQKPFIGRYQANGKPDSSFYGVGSRKLGDAPADRFSSVFPMSGGRFLATSGQLFARFKSNGDYDSTFGSNGSFFRPTPPGVNFSYPGNGILRPDGTIWTIAGSWPGGDVRLSIYAVDTTGKIDSTFGTNGFFMEGIAAVGGGNPFSSVLQSSGKLVVGCTQSDQGVRLVRIMKPGKIDSTFGTNGFVFVPGARMTSIMLLSGDRILVSQNNTPSPGSLFTLLDSSGITIPGFTINNGSSSLAIVGNGTEFLSTLLEEPSGEWTIAGGTWEFYVARVLPAARSAMPNIKQIGNTLDAQVNLPTATFQWYFNGNLLVGATAETLEISQVGTYKVVASSEKGCIGEDVFVVTVVGVSENLKQRAWSLYPNPAEEIISLEGPGPISAHSVVDVYGRELEMPENEGNQLDIRQLKTGLYWVRIQTKDGVVMKRFLKN